MDSGMESKLMEKGIEILSQLCFRPLRWKGACHIIEYIGKERKKAMLQVTWTCLSRKEIVYSSVQVAIQTRKKVVVF